jgi:hypothetical protein
MIGFGEARELRGREKHRDYVQRTLTFPGVSQDVKVEQIVKYIDDAVSSARIATVGVMLFIAFLLWGLFADHGAPGYWGP